MLRRIIVLSMFALLLSAAPAFSQRWGLGLSVGIEPLGGLPGSDAMLSVNPPQLPVTLGIGARVGGDSFQLGTTADWIVVRENLFSFVNVYAGPGLYLALPDEFDLGARVPIGLNAFPTDWAELFFEIAPNLAILTDGEVVIPDVGVQSGFGFRFWFDL